jgi:purine catabolism regulator
MGAEMNLTINEVLKLPCFKGSQILAGKNGLNNKVHLLNVMEVPDISSWVSENELVLTTAYPFKDNAAALVPLIYKLHEKKVSGIAIKLNRFIKNLPPKVISCADELGFPVISLSANAQFDKIIFETLTTIFNKDYAAAKYSNNLSLLLHQIAINGGTLQEIVRTLSNWCEGDITISDPNGHIIIKYADPSLVKSDERISFEKSIAFENRLYANIQILVNKGAEDKNVPDLIDTAMPSIMIFLMQKLIHDDSRKREEFLNDILSGHHVNSAKSMKGMNSYGIDLNAQYLVCVIRVNNLYEEQIMALFDKSLTQFMHNIISRDIPWPICVKMSDCIVHLYRMGKEQNVESYKQFYGKIYMMLSSDFPSILIGISSFQNNSNHISAHFIEAKNAIEFGSRLINKTGVFFYDQLTAEILLNNLVSEQYTVTFINNTLGALVSNKSREKISLLKTLEAILNGNTDKAIAEQLYIHPKTLAYRKKRIANILGYSIEDNQTRFRLNLALKLYCLIDKD